MLATEPGTEHTHSNSALPPSASDCPIFASNPFIPNNLHLTHCDSRFCENLPKSASRKYLIPDILPKARKEKLGVYTSLPSSLLAQPGISESQIMPRSSTLGRVHSGTSGWHYAHWRGPFYPAGLVSSKMLRCYADHFDTVEINNSFCRLPTTAALNTWCEQTPGEFCFAVKASRYITHNLKLKHPEEAAQKFLSQIGILSCFSCLRDGRSISIDWKSFSGAFRAAIATPSSFAIPPGMCAKSTARCPGTERPYASTRSRASSARSK